MAGERAGPSEPPVTFEGPPSQNVGAHAPTRQRPHLGSPLHSPQSRWIEAAGLLGANPNPRLAPEGPLPKGLPRNARDWGPPSRNAGLTLPPRQHRAARAPPIIQGGRTGRALPAPVTFEGPQRQNAGAHSPARQLPDLRPRLRSPQTADRACQPPGANFYLRSAPEGPLPRGLETQRRALGTPEPQRQIHPAASPPLRPLGAPPVIQGGRRGRALRAPSDV